MMIASEWEDKEAVRFEMRRISNLTNGNAPSDDVTNGPPGIVTTRFDNEEKHPNGIGNGDNNPVDSFNDNCNGDKRPLSNSLDEEKNCDGFEMTDSSSFSSEYLSGSSISSSSPLHSKSNTSVSATIENKYIAKLKGNLDPKEFSNASRGEAKQRRKVIFEYFGVAYSSHNIINRSAL